jgi:hypothetical protein
VQAWYQGGISVIDFTDSASPFEIAYFDRGPVFEDELVVGGFWSAYYYGGAIYGTEIIRGLDMLKLVPSEFLSENEIAAAALADQGRVFNPQQQFAVTWPDEPVVAHALLDQAQRAGTLSDEQRAVWDQALNRTQQHLQDGTRDRDLSRELLKLADTLDGADALVATTRGLAKRVR